MTNIEENNNYYKKNEITSNEKLNQFQVFLIK